MPIPESFLEELNSRTDIVDLVSSYVALSKKGNKYWGLCPFHSEKTASFSVSPDRQMYYCFGCHKGGGAINFVMEVEGLGFVDAVDVLAKRAGLQMPETAAPAKSGSGCWHSTKRRRAGFTPTCQNPVRQTVWPTFRSGHFPNAPSPALGSAMPRRGGTI